MMWLSVAVFSFFCAVQVLADGTGLSLDQKALTYQWNFGGNISTAETGKACREFSSASYHHEIYYSEIYYSEIYYYLTEAPRFVEEDCAIRIRRPRSAIVIDLAHLTNTCVSDPRQCQSGGFSWSVWVRLPWYRYYSHAHIVTAIGKEDRSKPYFSMTLTEGDILHCTTYYYSKKLSARVNTTSILSDRNAWHHIACVFDFTDEGLADGKAVEVYIDAVRIPNIDADENPMQEDYISTYDSSFLKDSYLVIGEWDGYDQFNYYDKSYSNLVVVDAVLSDEDIRPLYTCGSADWNPKVRRLFRITTAETDLQLSCTGSAADGPIVTWWVYLSKCREVRALRDDGGSGGGGGVEIRGTNVSSCIQNSTLTIRNYTDRGYTAGTTITCATTTEGDVSSSATASFTIPAPDAPASSTTESTTRQSDADPYSSLLPALLLRVFSSELNNDLCNGKISLEEEGKVITVAPLSAPIGEYNEVRTTIGGLVYAADIPGIVSPNNETLAVVMSVYERTNRSSGMTLNGETALLESQIVDIKVIDKAGDTFTQFDDDPVLIRFPVSKIPNGLYPVCSFQSRDKPHWYTYGCTVKKGTSSDGITCSCTHLTHFAILLQVQKIKDEDDGHLRTLTLLTRIGLSLSIACLAVTLTVFALYRFTSTRIITHANLALALMMSHITFMFIGTENLAACTAVAILLHFFLLAAFTWMALEGIYLYVQLTPTFRWKIRLPVWVLIGWGTPAGIVLISAIAQFGGYSRRMNSCWLSFDAGFIWAFFAPVLVIILVNVLIVMRLVIVFLSLRTIKDKSNVTKIKAGLRLLLILGPLLGLPWILNIFYVDKGTVVFAYLAVILNTLQGVFVFCLQCLFDKEVQQKFRSTSSKVSIISIVANSKENTNATSITNVPVSKLH